MADGYLSPMQRASSQVSRYLLGMKCNPLRILYHKFAPIPDPLLNGASLDASKYHSAQFRMPLYWYNVVICKGMSKHCCIMHIHGKQNTLVDTYISNNHFLHIIHPFYFYTAFVNEVVFISVKHYHKVFYRNVIKYKSVQCVGFLNYKKGRQWGWNYCYLILSGFLQWLKTRHSYPV